MSRAQSSKTAAAHYDLSDMELLRQHCRICGLDLRHDAPLSERLMGCPTCGAALHGVHAWRIIGLTGAVAVALGVAVYILERS